MQRFAYLALCLPLAHLAAACKSVECGPDTIDRGGVCQPANETVGTAKCGPFTELQGDQCVPKFPPTVCDPATTSADLDPTTGVTTCIGTGTGGCTAPFACPAPAAGKQTICGQIYNLADNSKFAAAGATGAACTAATSTGPCALQLHAFDAVAFGMNPSTTQPLATGAIYVDDCGRYRIPDVPIPGPFIAVGVDDANMPPGPTGLTNTTGIAVPAVADSKQKDVEAWVVDKATTDLWASTGGPPLSGGIYVGIFRQHGCNATTGVCTGDAFANQAGVTILKGMTAVPANDYYFTAEPGHQHVDPAATATSIDGAVLLTGATLADGGYTGTGGITDTANCQWDGHAAVSLPYIVFLQVFRPVAKSSTTCAQ